jgi:hypothetical protein
MASVALQSPSNAGRQSRDPSPTAARALALHALSIIRRVRRPDSCPPHRSDPSFARQIALIRLHLRPVRSRQVLAASFGREAFHGTRHPAAGADAGLVQVA